MKRHRLISTFFTLIVFLTVSTFIGSCSDRYDEGYSSGYRTGKEAGYDKGKKDGYTDGFKSGHIQGRLYNVKSHAITGIILGFSLAVIFLISITKRWWIEDFKFLIRQYKVSKAICGRLVYLDKDLRRDVFNLIRKNREICHFIASDKKLSSDQYCGQLRDKLKNWKNEMIRPAILAQVQRSALFKVGDFPNTTIEKQKRELERELAKADKDVKPQLEEIVKTEKQKLDSFYRTKNMIKTYKYRLKQYETLLNNLCLSIHEWKCKLEDTVKISGIENEISMTIKVIDEALSPEDDWVENNLKQKSLSNQ